MSSGAVGGSSSGQGGALSRVVVQDFIARIRYSNALPPPPTPPKLLQVPSGGLDDYTSAGFAARLAREQPLTIEADAELGMPIDMVGVPGVLFEDESFITAPEPVPAHTLHPADKVLLRPFSSLGSSTSGNPGVTFLRRTEYITSGTSRNDSSAFIRSKNSALLGVDKKTAPAPARKPVNKDDPLHITRTVLKGFDLAYPYDKYSGPESGTAVRGAEPTSQEKDAWDRPRHPTNPALKPVDMYPILPDFAATPDTGSYIIMKFKNNPVGPSRRYDERLDVGLFHVVDPKPEDLEHYQQQIAAREKDPSLPIAMPQYDFDLFLPAAESAQRLKRRLSMYAPDRDDDSLYDTVRTDDQARSFKLQRVRRYETYQQTGSGPEAPYAESIGIALHDPDYIDEDGVDPSVVGLPKAAYIYGIGQRTSIRPKRLTDATGAQHNPDDIPADAIELTVRDRTRRELRHVRQALIKYDTELPGRVIPELAGEWEEEDEEEEEVQAVEEEGGAVDDEVGQDDDAEEEEEGRRGRRGSDVDDDDDDAGDHGRGSDDESGARRRRQQQRHHRDEDVEDDEDDEDDEDYEADGRQTRRAGSAGESDEDEEDEDEDDRGGRRDRSRDRGEATASEDDDDRHGRDSRRGRYRSDDDESDSE